MPGEYKIEVNGKEIEGLLSVDQLLSAKGNNTLSLVRGLDSIFLLLAVLSVNSLLLSFTSRLQELDKAGAMGNEVMWEALKSLNKPYLSISLILAIGMMIVSTIKSHTTKVTWGKEHCHLLELGYYVMLPLIPGLIGQVLVVEGCAEGVYHLRDLDTGVMKRVPVYNFHTEFKRTKTFETQPIIAQNSEALFAICPERRPESEEKDVAA